MSPRHDNTTQNVMIIIVPEWIVCGALVNCSRYVYHTVNWTKYLMYYFMNQTESGSSFERNSTTNKKCTRLPSTCCAAPWANASLRDRERTTTLLCTGIFSHKFHQLVSQFFISSNLISSFSQRTPLPLDEINCPSLSNHDTSVPLKSSHSTHGSPYNENNHNTIRLHYLSPHHNIPLPTLP